MSDDRKLTPRGEDFSAWYNEVVQRAELADYSPVRGSMVIRPWGYGIWERMQRALDDMLKATGHENAYFPLLIPMSYLEKEAEHVEGFRPELAVVTHAGGKELEEPLVIRPTSETVILAMYAKWVQSHRDLPILINQWCNVMRWELRTRLFLRTSEFLWQEGHTAHATAEEADREALLILGVYREFMEEWIAMPPLTGLKTDAERFAGAVRSYALEALMQDNKALQAGTSHFLGQNFAKAAGVRFQSVDGNEEFAWSTSWGVSTRLVGGLVMTHGDDDGIVIPPRLAPVQVVVIPIYRNDDERRLVLEKASAVRGILTDEGVRVKVDERDHLNPGAKYYEWERKGVPFRMEIGPKDLEKGQLCLVRRIPPEDGGKKAFLPEAEALASLPAKLEDFQRELRERAERRRDENSHRGVTEWGEMAEILETKGGFVYTGWSGDPAVEARAKEEMKATVRVIPDQEFRSGTPPERCIGGEGKARMEVVWARAIERRLKRSARVHEHDRILILDYGSQFTQLIARRVREERVYSEIHPPTRSLEWIREWAPAGIILSGGPASVYDEDVPSADPELLASGVPILGICYGMQLIAHLLGADVARGRREYGRAELRVVQGGGLLAGFESGETTQVWCSHGDHVDEPPAGFQVLASTATLPVAAFAEPERRLYGVQFHPEVAHTTRGDEVLSNFLFGISGCRPTWTPGTFIEEAVEAVRAQVGEGAAVCGLSGGVDSSVAASLVHRAIGDRLTCIFVDNGLLRKHERDTVERMFRKHMGMRLVVVDATVEFLEALRGVEDPEEKRRAIGRVFIEVFSRTAREAGTGADFLVQGTLYPDVIESRSVRGPSATIKTHHNVGGLPENLPFELVEPLRELFKDEVRQAGRELGLPEEFVGRHPFPGPGLAVRVLGEITPERLEVLREADAIFLEEIRLAGLYDDIWQAFAVLLPVRAVGVMGDARTYDNVVALRAVTSRDGMTADWYPFPHGVLGRISTRIINEVDGVNRVTYDVSSKPPATIEWE